MAKNKISEYSSTSAGAGLNTDIATINIDEGCAPSGINNAIRALMAQLKDFQSGASGDTLPLASGGTGAANATSARSNLGLGAVATEDILPIAKGGTGATTLAGANIPVTNSAQTFTGKQTFTGSSSVISSKFINAVEAVTVSSTAATGTINYDVTTQSVLYYTSNATANFTVNFRGSSTSTLDSIMSTGESLTVAFAVTNGSTSYYNNAITIDGTSITPLYQNTLAWSAGTPSGVDMYSYTIVKTGSATFTVFASQTAFK